MRAKTVTQLELVANNEEAAVQPSADQEKDATRPIDETKQSTPEKVATSIVRSELGAPHPHSFGYLQNLDLLQVFIDPVFMRIYELHNLCS